MSSKLSDARYRLTLMKGGKYQASIRMGAEGLQRSGLRDMDRERIERLQPGAEYTDADGDRWTRLHDA